MSANYGRLGRALLLACVCVLLDGCWAPPFRGRGNVSLSPAEFVTYQTAGSTRGEHIEDVGGRSVIVGEFMPCSAWSGFTVPEDELRAYLLTNEFLLEMDEYRIPAGDFEAVQTKIPSLPEILSGSTHLRQQARMLEWIRLATGTPFGSLKEFHEWRLNKK